MMSNRCTICGAKWEAHEFAVPAPYCPDTYETLESQLSATKQKLEAAEVEADRNARSEERACWALHLANQRAEAAEARIKASQEQEPYAYVRYGLFGIPEFYTAPYPYTSDFALFKQPIISPTEAELLQRIAELENK